MKNNFDFNKERYSEGHCGFGGKRATRTYELIDKKKYESILDIGCENGEFLLSLPISKEKYGLDLIERKIKGCTTKICDLNKDKIPFKDESIDIVRAGSIIEHLMDTDFFLKEINRVLKKKGTLILDTHNLCSALNLRYWLSKDQLRYVDFSLEFGTTNKGHIRSYSPKTLKYQLNKHGFKINKITSDRVWFPLWTKVIRISEWLGKIFPERGEIIIIEAEKNE